jgi:hypothetical protein
MGRGQQRGKWWIFKLSNNNLSSWDRKVNRKKMYLINN